MSFFSNFWQSRRPLGEIFVILAGIWGGLAWYATWETPLNWEMELRQSPMRDYLATPDTIATFDSFLASLPGDTTAAAGISALSTTTAQDNTQPINVAGYTPPSPLSDTSSLYILLTGDSMSEGLMFAFEKYAKFNGHKLKTRVWYSSGTRDWGKQDMLTQQIMQFRPDFIIFTLGSNELFVKHPEERLPFIQNIVRAADAAGVPFVWIGPPNWKEDTGIGDLIQKAVGNDRYFLSKHLTFKRAKDGAHPTRESSAVWADTISSWIMHTSRYKNKLLLRDPKRFTDMEPRPYRATATDTLWMASRNSGGFKITAANESKPNRPEPQPDPKPQPKPQPRIDSLPNPTDSVGK